MSRPVLPWEHVGAGLVEPLDDFLGSAGSDYGAGDFLAPVIAANRWTGRFGDPLGEGPLLEIPVNCESYNLAFVPEILERAGVEVPSTWQGFFEAGAAVADRVGGPVRGFGRRGVQVWPTTYTGYATQFWSYWAVVCHPSRRCALPGAAREGRRRACPGRRHAAGRCTGPARPTGPGSAGTSSPSTSPPGATGAGSPRTTTSRTSRIRSTHGSSGASATRCRQPARRG